VDDLVSALKAEPIVWERDLDDPFLFHASALGHDLSLRIGNFPDEVMFSLSANGRHLDDFDNRPPGWEIPPRAM
jgi:hypothetical protein